MYTSENGTIAGIEHLLYMPEKEHYLHLLPILFFLGGKDISIHDFSILLNMEEALNALNPEQPIAVCCIDGNNSWYCNHYDATLYWEEIFITDFLRQFFQLYPISPISTAIGGFSMGGFGAMRLGLRYSNIFQIIGSHSASLRFEDEMTPDLLSERIDLANAFGNIPYYMQIHPLNYVYSGQHRHQHIRMDCGKSDYHISNNLRFYSLVKDFLPDIELHVQQGKHCMKYWKEKLPEYLDYYQKTLYQIIQSF